MIHLFSIAVLFAISVQFKKHKRNDLDYDARISKSQ